MATPLATDVRKQYQFDLLWNTMADNELLAYSAVQSLNKQLTTDNKTVIKAINELLTKLKINDTTVANFSTNFNSLVGNPELDTADWNNLKLIDTNVIKSIYKLYLDIVDKADADNVVTSINGQKGAVTLNVSGTGGNVLIYDTEAALQSAYPSGTDLPVWIKSTKNWFYWDGDTTPDVTPPTVTVSPAGGTFTSNQNVILSTEAGAIIYYTLDGSTPTQSSSVYTAPLTMTSSKTLKYFAKDTAGNVSTVQTQTYTLNLDTTAPVVTINPAPGPYTSSQSVTLTSNETATIYYTLDGTTPTTSSSVFSGALVRSSTTTIKYFAKDTAGNASTVQTATYTITIPDSTPPSQVQGLAVSSATSSAITATWNPNTEPDLAGYEVSIAEVV
jgi:hypothetical protein